MLKEEHMEKIKLYQLRNSSGFGVDVSNLGGTVVSLYTPDRDSNILDVALGFDKLSDYLDNPFYFGTTVTRVAGRLAGASIDIDGCSYKLPANDNGNTLHGGGGCRYDFFRVSKLDPATLSLRYDYPALESGFPGNLALEVIYQITDENELIIDYAAKSDAATPVNLTNHLYFNLNGNASGDISGHRFAINSSERIVTDRNLIPTGRKAALDGTPYDLRTPTLFSSINGKLENGFDDYFILETAAPGFMDAMAYSEKSGIEMRVYTTELGIQFYTGNFLDGTVAGKSGCRYVRQGGFCMETMGYPDAIHHADFPSNVLHPDDTYRQRTIYKFLTRNPGEYDD